MSAEERRTYVVGLPVIVTIDPDDFVTMEVDTGDLSKVLGEHSDYADELVRKDVPRIVAFAQTHDVSNEGYGS